MAVNDRLRHSFPSYRLDAARNRLVEAGQPASNKKTLENQLLQITLNNHVLDGAHSNGEQVRVRGICKVAINFTVGISAQRAKFVEEVLAGGSIIILRPMVVGEAVL